MANTASPAASRLVLTENKLLRLAAVALFYFTQGVPQGVFYLAIPAWLASEGASVADIAAVTSAMALPWSLKFVNGAIMDRYTYLAMGRRRAWIIGAQVVLTLAFLSGVILLPESTDIAVLSVLALAAGFGSAFQDVGIDSLAVDIMPEDERAKAASLMFGSAMLGMSFGTGITGLMLQNYGVAAAFIAAAFAPGLVLLFGLVVRERPGEKRLPWSQGEPHPRNVAIQVTAWWPLIRNAGLALFAPASLIFLLVLFTRQIPQGVADTMYPVMATRWAGWSLSDFTNLQSLIQLVAGGATLLVYGFVIDRIGAQRSLVIAATLMIALFTAIAMAEPYWTDSRVLTAFFFGYELIGMFLLVSLIPLAMRICTPVVAATQFTIYMAAGNLGRPVGAWFVGIMGEDAAVTFFWTIAGIFVLVLVIALTVRFPVNNKDEVESDLAPEASLA